MSGTWRDKANCRGADPALFMPLGRGTIPIDAMRICVDCPVRRDCLNMALEDNDPTADLGVFGGTTVRGRQKVRLGVWTVSLAMAQGDRMASRLTHAERRAA